MDPRLFFTKLYIFYLKLLVFLNKKKHNLKISAKEVIDELWKFIENRKSSLNNLDESKKWFEKNSKKISTLFENDKVRDYIFSGFKDLWDRTEFGEDRKVFAIITQVSIANAVLAGIPGKLGVGVVVCIALEFYMAYAIARRLGLEIDDTDDIWTLFKQVANYGLYFTFVGFIAIYAFRHLFSFVFSIIPGIFPQTIITEYIVTTFIGVLFWISFQQTKNFDLFKKKVLFTAFKKTKDLLKYQKNAIKDTFSKDTFFQLKNNLDEWFTGDYLDELPKIRGNVFVSLALGNLLIKNYESLEGPLGQLFIKSIRDRWSELENKSIEEISTFMYSEYTEQQIPSVITTIKGKFFENIIETQENSDGDTWIANLHKDESYPGSDIIITNTETGEIIELSLKATFSSDYIENSLLKYPEIPILTTTEVASEFKDLDMIIASDFQNSEITEITEKNFDILVNNLNQFTKTQGIGSVATGVGIATAIAVWPYVAAYVRGKISKEKLEIALIKVFPDAGKELAYRIGFIAIFGPIYAWWILAKTAMSLTPSPKDNVGKIRFITINN